jgi:hypothetical protein
MPHKFDVDGTLPLPRGRVIEDLAGVTLIPVVPLVSRDLGVSDRTVTRWLDDPDIGMPPVRFIRDRRYLVAPEYAAWKHDFLMKAIGQRVRTGASAEAEQAAEGDDGAEAHAREEAVKTPRKRGRPRKAADGDRAAA